MEQIDKAGADYWNANWLNSDLPLPFNHLDQTLDNYVNQKLHQYFLKIIENIKGLNILELGCASSVWPIYFSQYHEANVTGLDYSAVGCKKSKILMDTYKVPGNIYCSDLFQPPTEILNTFDLVVSFGLVEHFQNTAECLKACSHFLKPGGRLLTLVPNMRGLIGFLQKITDESIYNVHVPLDIQDVCEAHHIAGLKLLECDYFMSINLSVVNSQKHVGKLWHQYFRNCLSITSKLIWMLEKYRIRIPNSNSFSPYILALAEK